MNLLPKSFWCPWGPHRTHFKEEIHILLRWLCRFFGEPRAEAWSNAGDKGGGGHNSFGVRSYLCGLVDLVDANGGFDVTLQGTYNDSIKFHTPGAGSDKIAHHGKLKAHRMCRSGV